MIWRKSKIKTIKNLKKDAKEVTTIYLMFPRFDFFFCFSITPKLFKNKKDADAIFNFDYK